MRLYDIFCSSQSQIVFQWVQFEICSWKWSRFANYVMMCQLNFHCVTSRPNYVFLVHCAQKESALSVLFLRKDIAHAEGCVKYTVYTITYTVYTVYTIIIHTHAKKWCHQTMGLFWSQFLKCLCCWPEAAWLPTSANWPNLSNSFISDGQLNYHRYTLSSALSLS